ncbi:thioredoxin domain-containing protein [Candidatus Azambacteria bacterium]|nr:thioredoxin domain-containing protein [Candidatus Azambacteria bacterium]MBI3685065.1 thioredoxin domain-containing protein [Candidatus Azambacteria bacterium]
MTTDNADQKNTEGEIKELEERLYALKQQAKGNQENPWAVPAAIFIAGLLIAGAVMYSRGNSSLTQNGASKTAPTAPPPSQQQIKSSSGSVDNIAPVTNKDHIRGSLNAPVKVVEFSDAECPFCKRFHPTMQQAVKDYPNQVAWVYRHFPLDSLHSKARKEAEASECANELGGNDTFWAYLDRVFEVTPSNNGLDPAELPKIAQYVGLDAAKFEQCLSSGKYAQHVADNLADATGAGGQGTPYTVVIAQNGKKFVISGAQPYAAVKSVIDVALLEK